MTQSYAVYQEFKGGTEIKNIRAQVLITRICDRRHIIERAARYGAVPCEH
jgi:hypothetical protein